MYLERPITQIQSQICNTFFDSFFIHKSIKMAENTSEANGILHFLDKLLGHRRCSSHDNRFFSYRRVRYFFLKPFTLTIFCQKIFNIYQKLKNAIRLISFSMTSNTNFMSFRTILYSEVCQKVVPLNLR